MRLWLSGPRILNGLVRPGVSFGREDFHPRLPSWRRHELRHGLQEAAKARGEPMSTADCDYAIDKGLATGVLDSSGGLCFTAKGYTAEEVAAQIVERSTAWGQPVSRDDAMAMAERGKRRKYGAGLFEWVQFVCILGGVIAIIAMIFYAAAKHEPTYQDSPAGHYQQTQMRIET